MRRGVEAVGEAAMEGHLDEPRDGPDEQDEPEAGPRHPGGHARWRGPGDPARRCQLRRHGWAYDPGNAPHVQGLERLVVGRPHVPEEGVVDELHHEDNPEHHQGGGGVE